MRRLERYVVGRILLATLVTGVALLGLFFFLDLPDQLRRVGEGNYGLADAFRYMALRLPTYAYETFPFVALTGSLVALGGLASHGELTALRAAGMSPAGVLRTVLKAGLVLLLIIIPLGEWVAPHSEAAAQQARAAALTGRVSLQSRYGFWTKEGDTFVNVREVLPGGQLEQVYRFEFDSDGELLRALAADRARLEGRDWILSGVRTTVFGDERLAPGMADELNAGGLVDPRLLDLLIVKPESLPAVGLFQYIRHLRTNGQETRTLEVAFWGRVMMPLVALLMLVLSVPFVFGPLRTVGVGQRVVTGVVVGTLFYLLNRIAAYLAVVYPVEPLLAVASPTLLFLALGAFMLRRVH